jgi:hypothetical protein
VTRLKLKFLPRISIPGFDAPLAKAFNWTKPRHRSLSLCELRKYCSPDILSVTALDLTKEFKPEDPWNRSRDYLSLRAPFSAGRSSAKPIGLLSIPIAAKEMINDKFERAGSPLFSRQFMIVNLRS